MQRSSATATLGVRENCLSIFERQWASLEEQLTLTLESLEQAATPVAVSMPAAGQSLLQLCTPVAPFDDAATVDASLQARCTRMVEMAQSLARAFASAGGSDGAALVQRLTEERAPGAEMGLLRHRVAKSETALTDMGAQLQTANEQLDLATKTLQRERLRAANGNGGAGGASAPTAAAAPAVSGAKLRMLRRPRLSAATHPLRRPPRRRWPPPRRRCVRRWQRSERARSVSRSSRRQDGDCAAAGGGARGNVPAGDGGGAAPASGVPEAAHAGEGVPRSRQRRQGEAAAVPQRHGADQHTAPQRVRALRGLPHAAGAGERRGGEAARRRARHGRIERRSLELQVGQLGIQQRRDADALKDLASQLQASKGEAERARKEAARLKAELEAAASGEGDSKAAQDALMGEIEEVTQA